MNKRSQSYKRELEQLSGKEANLKCFDCDKSPAQWASINNGIYLCLECSGEHRGYGVGVSFIKSITLDQWNDIQLSLLRIGGNEQLKSFLLKYEMPSDKDKAAIYSSKLMGYYRRMLKAKSLGQDFEEYLPSEKEFWDNEPSNASNAYSNTFNIPSYSSNSFQPESSSSFKSSPSYPPYPKNEIVIDDNHYLKGSSYTDFSYSAPNSSSSTEPKFTQIESKYKDPRYGSVGSEPYQPSTESSSTSYWTGMSSFMGSVWGTSATVTSAIKDKMGEMEVGNKILYAGGKTLEAISYTGGKVYEKGSEIITSDTVKSIASSVGNGIVFLKDKIVGGQPNPYKDSGSRYDSRGSDDYYH